MSSRHLVDPEVLPLLEVFPPVDFEAADLPTLRTFLASLRPDVPLPPDVSVERQAIPGPAGAPDVPVMIVRPKAAGAARPAILHIHGGGYVLGEADASTPGNALYAQNLGAVVVSVDYRLAPETPFPGPVEDCYAALKWLHDHANDLGVDPARIAVSGESAGGGLAAATCLLARDRKEVPVRFQHLIFPMIDDRTATTIEPAAHLGEFVWNRAANRFGWRALLGHEPARDGVSPYAAPARAQDLSGLPPTFLITGALDLFLDEDMDYARRLIAAGVPTEAHVYPGAPHAFMLIPQARVSQAFARDSMAALARALCE
ncbi:MAG: alpha/beta hydrolase fold domain-containing protein [Alphaproteobacteria bacterium]|nr:alpha/beta hydrolase fold domain-containing protein [Alphaproteobacteria bacterium]